MVTRKNTPNGVATKAVVKRAVFTLVTLAMSVSVSSAALPPSIVSPSEIQRFEQSYETWVQTLTQTIAPSVPVTVLVNLEYSNSTDSINDFEDAREEDHLPGLPEVADPHFVHPSQSPLFTLVAQQRIKVIFEGSISDAQKRIINEVLTNKLKIKSNRGDKIEIEQVESALIIALKNTRKKEAAMIMFAVLLIAVLSATRRKKISPLPKIVLEEAAPKISTAEANTPNISVEPFSTVQDFTTPPPAPKAIQPSINLTDEKPLIDQLSKVNSKLSWQTRNTLDPLQVILKADANILLIVVRNEKSINLAQVIQSVSERLAATLLKLCGREQRNEIRSILVEQGQRFTGEQVRYQQLLLAAKVHRETLKAETLNANLERLIVAQENREISEIRFNEIKNLLVADEIATDGLAAEAQPVETQPLTDHQPPEEAYYANEKI